MLAGKRIIMQRVPGLMPFQSSFTAVSGDATEIEVMDLD